jgi:hypothetical protein
MALAMASLLLASCAEFGSLRSDVSHLRTDLHTTRETLSQLSARLDELERRQVTMDTAVRQTHAELTQAVEVLLKKALVTESRLSLMEGEKKRVTETARLDRPARQPLSAPQHAAPQENNFTPRSAALNLGMTQEDVRRTLGDPLSVENTGAYIFWQYSPQGNQKYVVFDKVTLQLWGWRGL